MHCVELRYEPIGAGTLQNIEWQQLQLKLAQASEEFACETDGHAFVYACAKEIFSLSGVDLEEAVTDGAQDLGIDAILIDETGIIPHIHLMQCKLHSTLQNAQKKSFPGVEINKVVAFFDDLFGNPTALKGQANPKLQERLEDIERILRSSVPSFTVYLVSNGQPLGVSEAARLSSFCARNNSISWKEFSSKELLEVLVSPRRAAAQRSFQASGLPGNERSDGDIRGVTATVSVEELYKLLRSDRDPNLVDKSLFDENVRIYLGVQNDINNRIFDSATKVENAKFWYLNNGITVVCDRYSYVKGRTDPLFSVTNPQIVNGCQTANVLFEAYRQHRDRVAGVSVLVRICETTDKAAFEQIASATNTQTRIEDRDLRANDDIQKRIEDILLGHKYFYERKRGQHARQPVDQRIDARKLGQVILATLLGEPHLAKTRSDEIFKSDYSRIFSSTLDIQFALEAFRCLQRIEKQRFIEDRSMRYRGAKAARSRLLSYGLFQILFAMQLVAKQKQMELSDKSFNFLFDESIRVLETVVSSLKNTAFYELFRDSRTTERVKEVVSGAFGPQLNLDLSIRENSV